VQGIGHDDFDRAQTTEPPHEIEVCRPETTRIGRVIRHGDDDV
jgi:hypothetical protein